MQNTLCPPHAGRTNPNAISNDGEHNKDYSLSVGNGEELRGEGSLSAPPPPGFNTDNHEERVRTANQAIWTDASTGLPANWSMDTRTTSFSNLAAMVGTGLAESMEDSTQDSRREGMIYDLSYARQSRHAASRLLGTSSSGLSPTAAFLDLTFPIHPHARRTSDAASFLNSSAHSPANNNNNNNNNRREPPSTLPPFSHSAEIDPMEDFRSNVQFRNQQLPMAMFDSSRPTEVGVTVMEPDMGRQSAPPQLYREREREHSSNNNGTPEISRQGTPDVSELNRGLQGMTIENQSLQSGGDVSLHSATEAELEPFLWDVNYAEPSRTIAILRAGIIRVQDIRSTCEAFGAIELFRSDFAHRGIIFVGFYDIRSSHNAVLELTQSLARLSSAITDIEVKFCVPLNSSSSHDESIIVLSDLPRGLTERQLMAMLSSYGSIRSMVLQGASRHGGGSYVVEFHNIQESKLALLELDSSQLWGQKGIVEVGARRAIDQRKGRELLSVIGSWRQLDWLSHPPVQNNFAPGHSSQTSRSKIILNDYGQTPSHPGYGIHRDSTAPLSTFRGADRSNSPSFGASITGDSDTNLSNASQPSRQLVIGPDGHYAYVVGSHTTYSPPHRVSSRSSPHRSGTRQMHPQIGHHQQVLQVPHGPLMTVSATQSQGTPAYWGNAPHHQESYQLPGGVTSPRGPVYGTDLGPYQQSSPAVPFYSHVSHVQQNPTDPSVSSGSAGNHSVSNQKGSGVLHRRQQTPPSVGGIPGDDKDNRQLTLDIQAVQEGRETRTSLMVRNIPNKYTQQMLINEFAEHGHGPGKIDFFYLPIDFKNKCNRGYAFINFVDYQDIVPFHRQYFGQHWRVFNSEKMCDITYARIQGKSSMLKRFENSALMEKDEEYKPLVFVSHGVDKGKRLPFPTDNGSR